MSALVPFPLFRLTITRRIVSDTRHSLDAVLPSKRASPLRRQRLNSTIADTNQSRSEKWPIVFVRLWIKQMNAGDMHSAFRGV